MHKSRVSPTAYKRVVRQGKPEESLSVCCKEIGNTAEIMTYFHKVILQEEGNMVFATSHTVKEINKAANKAKPAMVSRQKDKGYLFDKEGKKLAAYEHQPSKNPKHSRLGKSHSGVMFVCIFDELIEQTFTTTIANNVAKKKTKLLQHTIP